MKFIARQPILTRERSVFAYELLFRSGIQNSCEGVNLEQASASMFDTSFLIGLQRLTGGQRAFVNCPRDFLLRDYISLFPRDLVVVELLETIEPDVGVVDACHRLKKKWVSACPR
jgi:EAL and modified HD-GYP domain-containing signal transduction protein